MPNRGLDVYVHSWNPELGAVWDALRPARVWHQPIIRGLSALRSQHLSLKRVLSLVPDSIRLMLVSRLDVLLFTDVLLRPLLHDEAVAAGHEALWLPHHCQNALGPTQFDELRAVHAECGCAGKRCAGISGRGQLAEAPSVSRRGFRVLTPDAHHSLFVLDWLYVATAATARSFALIGEHFESYERQIAAKALVPHWAHFYWAHHVTTSLGPDVSVRFLPKLLAGVDLILARFIRFGRDCEAPVTAPSNLPRTLNATMVSLASDARPTVVRLRDQCPARLRHAAHVLCPWYAPVCAARHADETVAAIRRAELALRHDGLTAAHPFDATGPFASQRKVLAAMVRLPRYRHVRARVRDV